MTALVGGRGGEDPFTSNLVSECIDQCQSIGATINFYSTPTEHNK